MSLHIKLPMFTYYGFSVASHRVWVAKATYKTLWFDYCVDADIVDPHLESLWVGMQLIKARLSTSMSRRNAPCPVSKTPLELYLST